MAAFLTPLYSRIRGGSRGGGVLTPRTPPPPFWGTPKFHKEVKTSRACARIHHVLVLNSYPDPPPLSEILYPPLPKICRHEKKKTNHLMHILLMHAPSDSLFHFSRGGKLWLAGGRKLFISTWKLFRPLTSM